MQASCRNLQAAQLQLSAKHLTTGPGANAPGLFSFMPTIYAIALGSRDGDTSTELRMAIGARNALEAMKALASKHIGYVLSGEYDAQQFVDKINSATSIEQVISLFDDGMQEAHDQELENAYSAELVFDAIEV